MPRPDECKSAAAQLLPQHGCEAARGPLPFQELAQAAHKQRGKAAGVDQWHGGEVASIPAEVALTSLRAVNAVDSCQTCGLL